MDYEKTYNKLIAAARTQQIDGYYETHHIVPKAEGGSDDTTNLVKLTARQHYIAHLLLAKIYNDCAMYCALAMMKSKTTSMDRDFHFNSRLYEKMKMKRSKFMSERMRGNTNGLGYKFTEEQRRAASDRLKGKGNPMYGKHLSDATKAKISEGCKGHPYNGGGFCNPETVWWNNGAQNKRCVAQPGPEWRRGRLKKKSSEN